MCSVDLLCHCYTCGAPTGVHVIDQFCLVFRFVNLVPQRRKKMVLLIRLKPLNMKFMKYETAFTVKLSRKIIWGTLFVLVLQSPLVNIRGLAFNSQFASDRDTCGRLTRMVSYGEI